jgi:hypothetical protein
MKRTNAILLVLILVAGLLSGCDLNSGTPTPMTSAGGEDWHLFPATDPTAPALLVASGGDGAQRFQPGWTVDSIEYVDNWWGLGDPGFNDLTVKRAGTGYTRGDTAVPAADVQALVAALDQLYPAQMLMAGHAWTDDYPSWAVELVGTDGQHVLLFASSTGNPGNGPWTVLYNGRLYAQYDGALAKPLGRLFGGRLGSDTGPSEGRAAGQVDFATTGLPDQLVYGFWGLLPISRDFSYIADAGKGQITGQVTGSSRIGSMQIGQITQLDSLQISAAGAQVTCHTELLPAGDPFTPTTAWKFTCPVQGVKVGQDYRYPIQARFRTDKGEEIAASGELWGTWRTPESLEHILLPPPPEIAAALAANPAARDLLTDHFLGTTRYSASLTASQPLGGQRSGEAILFGKTVVDGRPVRYTVGAQFVIAGGKLTYWDLDRTALNALLARVTAQPLTRRVAQANPHIVLNLWYTAGAPPTPQVRSMDSYQEPYAAQVNACGAVPGGSFPAAGQPLEAFAYDYSDYFDRAPFILVGGRPVVANLALDPAAADPARKALLPDALDMGSGRPFASVYMEATPYGGGGPTLRIGIPQNASAAEQAAYADRLRTLPGSPAKEETQTVVRGVTLAIGDDGKLQVVSCAAPPAATPTRQADATPGGPAAAPPRLVYSTYYGSTDPQERHSTSANALAVDAAENAYIAGTTSSAHPPLKNPYRATHTGDLWDSFLATLDPHGASLLYGTYLGSGTETIVSAIAIDGQGNIYLTGSARAGFLTQNSAIQTSVRGDADAFVMKLSADGQRLLYATLLGGSHYDIGYRIAVDKEGATYVTGNTRSSDFPTARPLQAHFGGQGQEGRGGDAFVAKISPDGRTLVYSTYLGGQGSDAGGGIAVDTAGNAYVAGYTLSADFPLAQPLQATLAGDGDGFVAKISPDGSRLIYSTFLGGSGGGVRTGGAAREVASEIAVDAAGNAYVAGRTPSPDFPLVRPLDSRFNGGVGYAADQDPIVDAFVAELNPAGTALIFSTFLGGSGAESSYGLGLDAVGNIYVGGSTTSPDFPLRRPLQAQYSDAKIGLAPDSFIVKLRPAGAAVDYATYFGAEGFDALSGFAVDARGHVYIAGSVDAPSPQFPLAGQPFQATNTGIRSAFLAEIADDAP